jgi:alpha-glucosidase
MVLGQDNQLVLLQELHGILQIQDDQPRHYYRYRNGRDSDSRARVAAALIMTLRGTPYIYYGEEIGMTCENVPKKHIQDPLGKRGWPVIKGRDGERTPMQWDSSKNSGFSSGTPWIPVNSDYANKNVEAQSHDKNSLLSFYRSLIWLRKNSKALTIGDIEFLIKEPNEVLIYKRKYGDEEKIVLLNFSNNPQHVSINEKGNAVFGTHREMNVNLSLEVFEVQPYEVIILGKV